MIWVLESNMAGFRWVRFYQNLAGPDGPKQLVQKVGHFAPHLLEDLLGPPEPARPQTHTPKNQARLPFRYPI